MTQKDQTSPQKFREYFQNVLDQHIPILNIIQHLRQQYPDGTSESMPKHWNDPLDLYGCYLQELITLGLDLDTERMDLQGMLEKESPEWIWDNRLSLVAVRIFLRDFLE